MRNFLEYFKRQLEMSEIQACNGKYLEDESEEAKNAIINALVEESTYTVVHPTKFELIVKAKTFQEVEEFVNGKIEEWKNHKGDKLLFYFFEEVIDQPDEFGLNSIVNLQVRRVWDSDVNAVVNSLLEQGYNIVAAKPGSDMPRITKSKQ